VSNPDFSVLAFTSNEDLHHRLDDYASPAQCNPRTLTADRSSSCNYCRNLEADYPPKSVTLFKFTYASVFLIFLFLLFLSNSLILSLNYCQKKLSSSNHRLSHLNLHLCN